MGNHYLNEYGGHLFWLCHLLFGFPISGYLISSPTERTVTMSALSDAIMSNIVANVGGQNEDARATRAAVDVYVKTSQAQLAGTVTSAIADVSKALSAAKESTAKKGKPDDDTVKALQSVMAYLPTILSS